MESLFGDVDSCRRRLKSNEPTCWASCLFNFLQVLFEQNKHVDPLADGFRTWVRLPPPPPTLKAPDFSGAFFI